MNLLKKECSESNQVSFSIAEVHYAGSVAKHTNISTSSYHPDFDLVLKLHRYYYSSESSDDDDYDSSSYYESDEEETESEDDDITELFAEALQFFEKVIRKNARSLKVDEESIKVREHSMYFEFYSGACVDLLPAEADLTLAQVRSKIYAHNKDEYPGGPRKWTFYSSSLVEDQVQFMKDQNGFTHRLARLAKYWLKSLVLPGKISGGSLMMELLAVAAVKQLEIEGARGEPLLQGFYCVMCLIGRLDNLEIAFKRPRGRWMLMSGNDLKCGGGGQLPNGIYRPFIVEPTNLCHNLLEEMGKGTMKRLMSYARAKASHIQDTHRKHFNVETLSFQY